MALKKAIVHLPNLISEIQPASGLDQSGKDLPRDEIARRAATGVNSRPRTPDRAARRVHRPLFSLPLPNGRASLSLDRPAQLERRDDPRSSRDAGRIDLVDVLAGVAGGI